MGKCNAKDDCKRKHGENRTNDNPQTSKCLKYCPGYSIPTSECPGRGKCPHRNNDLDSNQKAIVLKISSTDLLNGFSKPIYINKPGGTDMKIELRMRQVPLSYDENKPTTKDTNQIVQNKDNEPKIKKREIAKQEHAPIKTKYDENSTESEHLQYEPEITTNIATKQEALPSRESPLRKLVKSLSDTVDDAMRQSTGKEISQGYDVPTKEKKEIDDAKSQSAEKIIPQGYDVPTKEPKVYNESPHQPIVLQVPSEVLLDGLSKPIVIYGVNKDGSQTSMRIDLNISRAAMNQNFLRDETLHTTSELRHDHNTIAYEEPLVLRVPMESLATGFKKPLYIYTQPDDGGKKHGMVLDLHIRKPPTDSPTNEKILDQRIVTMQHVSESQRNIRRGSHGQPKHQIDSNTPTAPSKQFEMQKQKPSPGAGTEPDYTDTTASEPMYGKQFAAQQQLSPAHKSSTKNFETKQQSVREPEHNKLLTTQLQSTPPVSSNQIVPQQQLSPAHKASSKNLETQRKSDRNPVHDKQFTTQQQSTPEVHDKQIVSQQYSSPVHKGSTKNLESQQPSVKETVYDKPFTTQLQSSPPVHGNQIVPQQQLSPAHKASSKNLESQRQSDKKPVHDKQFTKQQQLTPEEYDKQIVSQQYLSPAHKATSKNLEAQQQSARELMYDKQPVVPANESTIRQISSHTLLAGAVNPIILTTTSHQNVGSADVKLRRATASQSEGLPSQGKIIGGIENQPVVEHSRQFATQQQLSPSQRTLPSQLPKQTLSSSQREAEPAYGSLILNKDKQYSAQSQGPLSPSQTASEPLKLDIPVNDLSKGVTKSMIINGIPIEMRIKRISLDQMPVESEIVNKFATQQESSPQKRKEQSAESGVGPRATSSIIEPTVGSDTRPRIKPSSASGQGAPSVGPSIGSNLASSMGPSTTSGTAPKFSSSHGSGVQSSAGPSTTAGRDPKALSNARASTTSTIGTNVGSSLISGISSRIVSSIGTTIGSSMESVNESKVPPSEITRSKAPRLESTPKSDVSSAAREVPSKASTGSRPKRGSKSEMAPSKISSLGSSVGPSSTSGKAPSKISSVGPSSTSGMAPSKISSLGSSVGPSSTSGMAPSKISSLGSSVGPSSTSGMAPSKISSLGSSLGPSSTSGMAPSKVSSLGSSLAPSATSTIDPRSDTSSAAPSYASSIESRKRRRSSQKSIGFSDMDLVKSIDSSLTKTMSTSEITLSSKPSMSRGTMTDGSQSSIFSQPERPKRVSSTDVSSVTSIDESEHQFKTHRPSTKKKDDRRDSRRSIDVSSVLAKVKARRESALSIGSQSFYEPGLENEDDIRPTRFTIPEY